MEPPLPPIVVPTPPPKLPPLISARVCPRSQPKLHCTNAHGKTLLPRHPAGRLDSSDGTFAKSLYTKVGLLEPRHLPRRGRSHSLSPPSSRQPLRLAEEAMSPLNVVARSNRAHPQSITQALFWQGWLSIWERMLVCHTPKRSRSGRGNSTACRSRRGAWWVERNDSSAVGVSKWGSSLATPDPSWVPP